MNKAADLETRLVKFSVSVLAAIRNMPNISDRHLIDQLKRSSTSPALNYGEARSAESINDFIHKLSLVLKELRETFNTLRIIEGVTQVPIDSSILSECDELISIFVASLRTAQQRRMRDTP